MFNYQFETNRSDHNLFSTLMIQHSWSFSLQVNCVRMLWEPCVLTASHDGTVKMWDVRTDTCVATVGRSVSAILCVDCDNDARVIAAAGMDG
mgnify:FL=1